MLAVDLNTRFGIGQERRTGRTRKAGQPPASLLPPYKLDVPTDRWRPHYTKQLPKDKTELWGFVDKIKHRNTLTIAVSPIPDRYSPEQLFRLIPDMYKAKMNKTVAAERLPDENNWNDFCYQVLEGQKVFNVTRCLTGQRVRLDIVYVPLKTEIQPDEIAAELKKIGLTEA